MFPQQQVDPDLGERLFSSRGLVFVVGLALLLWGKDPVTIQIGGIILAAFGVVLALRARRKRVVPVSDYVATAVWVAIFLSPIYFAVTKQPHPDEVENREGYCRRLCPDWIEGNIWDKYVRGQNLAWCRNYEDRLAADGLLPSRKPKASTSGAASSNPLWK
ncbi:hypothetical protein D9M69_483280 [compost metagenome]